MKPKTKASDPRSDTTSPRARAERLVTTMKRKQLEQLVLAKFHSGHVTLSDLTSGVSSPPSSPAPLHPTKPPTPQAPTTPSWRRLPEALHRQLTETTEAKLFADFKLYDTKERGVITLDSFIQQQEKVAKETRASEADLIYLFERMDTDRDGLVSYSEFALR
jgi:hypothetical protein